MQLALTVPQEVFAREAAVRLMEIKYFSYYVVEIWPGQRCQCWSQEAPQSCHSALGCICTCPLFECHCRLEGPCYFHRQLLPAIRSQGNFSNSLGALLLFHGNVLDSQLKWRTDSPGTSHNLPDPCKTQVYIFHSSSGRASRRSHHQWRWEAVIPLSLLCITCKQIVPICCVGFMRQKHPLGHKV